MDNRTKSMIATIASVVLCGCPGLFLCIFGIAAAMGSGTYTLGTDSGNIPPMYGYVLLCLSVLMILIPVGVAFYTLWKKPGSTDVNPPPPTSSSL
jgi:hypothetical protein